ncbi:iron-containing alcohol dehydrogenase [Luethyella okanaganae]|uniref:Iron-containing alcohol dehydrogenase n=1 Tax=Luethyella okanaganae TaxID=69372 RepID=A0ABW1VGQ5_9MICO
MNESIGVLRLPNEVRFGFGARAAIAPIVAGFGRRVLVVADPFIATTAEFAEVVEAMRAITGNVEVLTDVPPELPSESVHRAGAIAASFAPEVIVGYGGGSALDAAKLVAVLVTHGGSLDDYYGENAVPGPVVPLVAVPTTAGTGSEVTPVAVISDPHRELKVGISSPHLIPRAAVVDPQLTMDAPVGVTTFAGIDAFVHAVESYTAAQLEIDHAHPSPVFVGQNRLTHPLSLEAARIIFRALPVAVRSPHDRQARADMAYGSLLAGMAFGATGTHLSHAIQYPIGAMTHTPHGLGTGTLLPYVMQACVDAIPEAIATLGEAMGVTAGAGGATAHRAQATVDAIAAFCADVGLPASLAELGVSRNDRDRIVELTLQVARLVAIAPIPVDRALLGRLVDAAIVGDRSLLVARLPTPGPAQRLRPRGQP